jgi:hypothetical protein
MIVAPELVAGIGIGLALATVLFSSQHFFRQLVQLLPCGCVGNIILGLLFIGTGIVLLVVGGYLQL